MTRAPGAMRNAKPTRLTQASIILGIPLATLDCAVTHGEGRTDERSRVAAAICEQVLEHPGCVVLITGPSGSGKSTALATARRTLRTCAVLVRRDGSPRTLATDSRRMIEMATGVSTRAWLGFLADAGLAEARLLNRRARELSDGQRSRLALALMLAATARVRRPTALIVDEFAALLDRATAQSCAASLARAIRRSAGDAPRSLMIATSHEDLIDALRPDVHVSLDARRPARVHVRDHAGFDFTTPTSGDLA